MIKTSTYLEYHTFSWVNVPAVDPATTQTFHSLQNSSWRRYCRIDCFSRHDDNNMYKTTRGVVGDILVFYRGNPYLVAVPLVVVPSAAGPWAASLEEAQTAGL